MRRASSGESTTDHLVQLELASLENGFPLADRIFFETLDGKVNGFVWRRPGVEGLVDDTYVQQDTSKNI